MNKEKRKQGEKYLKNWGQSIIDIERIQNDINKAKRENDVFNNIQIKDKSDIINIYNEVLDEKLKNLKQVICDYKFVDDIITDLEEYQKDIIKYRYIYKNSWQAVALKAHISLRQCFNIKNLVINKILEHI